MDSYQDDRYLPFWDEADVDIRVIHLTRDVRSCAFAITQGAPKRSSPSELTVAALVASHRDERRFAQLGDRMFRLGYEELALQPEHTAVCVAGRAAVHYRHAHARQLLCQPCSVWKQNAL